MMLPCTITFLASVSLSPLPSKIRTFRNRVNPTLGADGVAGGDDTVAGGGVVATPVAEPPGPDSEGAPD
jgi:hypothetical protein